MKVICAWCAREGRSALIGERAPLDDATETHGICPPHRRAIAAQVPAPCFPDVDLLIVVPRDDERLYEYLSGRLAGVAEVHVLLDRRRGDRRRRREPVDAERRQAERRLGRGESLGGLCTTVRFRDLR